MILSRRSLRLGLIGFVALGLAACGGSPPPAETPADIPEPEPVVQKEEPKEEEPPPPPPRKTAKEMITAGTTFRYVLAESDPAQAKKAECEKKAKGDEEKSAACLKSAEELAAKDGIRFDKGDDESWWWVAFSEASGKEVLLNKVKFEIAEEAEASIKLTPQGKDLGKKPMKKLPEAITLEAPDEKTLVMNDPAKGKPVYRAE